MAVFSSFTGKWAAAETSGRFRPGLFVGHGAFVGWLLASSLVFRGVHPVPDLAVTAVALVAALLLWGAGWHQPPGTFSPGATAGRAAGLFAGLTAVFLATSHFFPIPFSLPVAAWTAAATVATTLLGRWLITRLATPAGPEAWRWLALAAATVWLYAPLYDDRPSGGGDAMWYKFMLADFVHQVRAGGLPVWAGQTEYAFNGAIIPLRLAPGYQHAGAFVDLLTGRALEFVALNNLLLALTALAGAFSAYFCFRALLARQPWSAAVLAFLYIASPAILAPLSHGDQYMTFLTTPVLPVTAFALWGILSSDRPGCYPLLAASLAALWLIHSPVALCLTFLASLGVAVGWVGRRQIAWRGLGLGAVAFICLGSLPFLSILSLPLPDPGVSPVDRIISYNQDNHPAVFLPVPETTAPSPLQARYYQPGYAALALGVLALAWFIRRPTLAAGVFLLLVGMVMVLLLPIPRLNAFLWHQIPGGIAHILNTWTVQRLVGLWVVLLLTLGADALATLAPDRPRRVAAALCLLLAVGWTASQAQRLAPRLRLPVERNDVWRSTYDPHNLVLSRYSFNGFKTVPSYFSHGYIDPYLEHRLLHRDGTLLASNAESAVRRGPLPAPDTGGELLAQGTWRAVNDNHTDFYNLNPVLTLPPGERLALWLEPLEPGQRGWLQFGGEDLFREYILPDSGEGSQGRAATRGFGTLPDSSHVVSLFTHGPSTTPRVINIAPDHQPAQTDFDFARYALWRYEPATLPVAVRSWAPYVLQVRSPEDAYVDTPRAWLPHYRATVNGRDVAGEASPDGTVMFPVPAGVSDVLIRYVAPLWLACGYWLTLASWCLVGMASLIWLARGRRVPSPNIR